MKWKSVRKEMRGKIMKTDIVCEVLCADNDEDRALFYVKQAFEMFRDFEQRYSRFVAGNELWQMNMSEKIQISDELFDIIKQTQRYYEITGGMFDPSILPALESSGYVGAYENYATQERNDFSQLVLDEENGIVIKPKNLMIDLGGIGKGFIVDTVARFLGEQFENVLVDAGGDIAVRGVNAKEGYPYWAIDIEHPQNTDESVALLLLKDMAVATSGRNRRHWMHKGQDMHHIIDPITQKSASHDLLSVSVVASTATEADVFAKTLFIAGREKGKAMAEALQLPAVFIDKDGIAVCNHSIEPYVWKS